ncbi:latexin isoform X3 [Motacilla alba alba]|uniref:latexin isoform X3 n=1 Tax=Motacilla alba alba TaxID=1094192 RepID=UPI0018D5190B|nr:latexin isoform X3 [Motacilla alba alba]
MELPPGHFPAARAAAAALGYLRYRRGGPGRGLQLRELRRARRQDIDDEGHKYYLELELEDVLDKDSTVSCTAEVLYHLGSRTSAPDVQVTVHGELRSTQEADKEFYNWIRSLEKELVAENIPDSHGNIPPELEPIHLLAWVASGYVIWQNSTENTKFHLAQVQHVKQVKRSDEDLQFDFVVLLHEMVSQRCTLPWNVASHFPHSKGIPKCCSLSSKQLICLNLCSSSSLTLSCPIVSKGRIFP